MIGVSLDREKRLSMLAWSVPHRTSEWMVMAPHKRRKKAVLLKFVAAVEADAVTRKKNITNLLGKNKNN